MTTQGLLITLLDPVVLPSQAATASRMETLTYLPGATLLGIAAETLYGQLGEAGAFHSGAVRFEDAFPLNDNGHLCLPAPISLHRSKGDAPTRATSAKDFATAERAPAYKQIRGKDVVLDGSADFFTPKRMASMRTAIAFDTGLADEGQLYGYEALSPGQRFRARVSGRADWVAQITEALCGEHFIGRSKTAEFGRVRIENEDTDWFLPGGDAAKEDRFVWFLSDAWLHDANGLPTARPEAGLFNAETIDWAHSFVRTRRVAPYNATWNARGEERELIIRGSVLTLTGCDLAPGLHVFGMGQERGHGLAFVSADPLGEVLKTAVDPIAPQPLRSPKASSTPFSEWLAKRLDRVKARQKAAQEADADLEKLRDHYIAAKRIAGADVGPTSSQWAGLASRLAADISVDKMLDDSDEDSKLWGARFDAGENDKGTFRGFVKEVFAQDGGPERLRHLARKMRRAMDDPNWPDQKTGGAS